MKRLAYRSLVGLTAVTLAFAGSNNAVAGQSPASLSVLTYNVHGLPWPLATGRDAAFASMITQLKTMRSEGRQPHVVVLQEAFTSEAKDIGKLSGYRYVANGPAVRDRSPVTPTILDREFADRASFLSGEKSGKILGSGLQILSDYPIMAVRTRPFPAFACAGYDCLANKGILMALIDVPRSATPVVISTAHFNSRHASGVSNERSDYVYRRQWEVARQFFAASNWHAFPMVFAGDFNVGKSTRRQTTFHAIEASLWTGGRLGPVRDALHACRISSCKFPASAAEALSRGKDWQLFASTSQGGLAAERIQVPFGRAANGSMLSDHIGYSAIYRLSTQSPVQLAQMASGANYKMRSN